MPKPGEGLSGPAAMDSQIWVGYMVEEGARKPRLALSAEGQAQSTSVIPGGMHAGAVMARCQLSARCCPGSFASIPALASLWHRKSYQ